MAFILAAVVSFLVALLLKVIVLAIKTRHPRRAEVADLLRSGGMPSSHAATVAGLAIAIGMVDGFTSAIFVLSAVFAAVVMTDATQVRRAVGEQGESLRELIRREFAQDRLQPDEPADALAVSHLHRARGHTPFEVFCGAVVGAVCAIIIVKCGL